LLSGFPQMPVPRRDFDLHNRDSFPSWAQL